VIGKIPVGDICVNGSVTGEVDSTVLRDRKLLSRDGVVVATLVIDARRGKLVGKPSITTRGFIDAKENRALIQKNQDAVVAALNHDRMSLRMNRNNLNARVRDLLARSFYEQIHRRPVVIPIIIEVGKPSPPIPLSGEVEEV
jgi:Predicted hydrolase of the metallo-beta-lactamase superfamily